MDILWLFESHQMLPDTRGSMWKAFLKPLYWIPKHSSNNMLSKSIKLIKNGHRRPCWATLSLKNRFSNTPASHAQGCACNKHLWVTMHNALIHSQRSLCLLGLYSQTEGWGCYNSCHFFCWGSFGISKIYLINDWNSSILKNRLQYLYKK